VATVRGSNGVVSPDSMPQDSTSVPSDGRSLASVSLLLPAEADDITVPLCHPSHQYTFMRVSHQYTSMRVAQIAVEHNVMPLRSSVLYESRPDDAVSI
jgi:hypothetical protein